MDRVLVFLTPRPGLIKALWSPTFVTVAEGLHGLVLSLSALGCPLRVCETEEEARAWVDDERSRCVICDDGQGSHFCELHAEERLLAGLVASQEHPRRAS